MFVNPMVEPDKRECHNNTSDLEDTVRNLREENAKLLQLLRSQGLLIDPPANTNGKSTDPISSGNNQQQDSTNITFDHSELTLTNNSITTTNQINHQHIHNHGPVNQQNYNEQTIHGNQSNITPNFNTIVQTTTQPFIQNNSNTLVQNNTNLIQPINLVNFNNVSVDSIQSFFASQSNVVYLSQTSSSAATTTTTTTTTTSANSNLNESLSTSTSMSEQHQISVRPKSSVIRQHQELVPVIPKMKAEHYESITRQSSSSSSSVVNNDTTNLLDNDSSQKYPRPIRPKPSSRTNSLRVYTPVVVNESIASSTVTSNVLRPSSPFVNNNNTNSPTISLFSSPTYSSSPSTTNYLSQSSSIEQQMDIPPQFIHSTSLDLSDPTTTKKSNKSRPRNRKKPSTSSVNHSLTNSSLVPIAPNLGRPLAPAPSNTTRTATSNNPITKRSTTNKKSSKRSSKTLVHCQSESILQTNSSSPTNTFAESISGLLENFDQELIASNFLAQTTTTTTTTSNLLSEDTHPIPTLDRIDVRHLINGAIQRQEIYHTTTASMPTLDEFNDRLETNTHAHQTTHDFNVENEQITSFMNEEDMRLVEMNFDENTFLKQFDLEDAGIRLSVHSDQNLFANILTDNNIPNINEQSITIPNPSVVQQLALPLYSGSSLINNNLFTTVVPLGLQQQTSQTSTLIKQNTTIRLPEEGVQLTARHIEPSQVATYESVKYQDILDDLVMVTDQDALRHAQAAAADDPSVVSSDFSFALLEATNEIIKNTNIQLVDDPSSTFTELQYFYPIEQEQELLQKQLKTCQEKQADILPNQQPVVTVENLQSKIIVSSSHSNEPLLDSSMMTTSITDLSSILQFDSTSSPSSHDRSTMELITPVRATQSTRNDHQQTNLESLLPATQLPHDSTHSYSPISDTLVLSSNSLRSQDNSKACILFEPISSSSTSSSPLKTSHNEMIIDSGRLDQLSTGHMISTDHDEEIEELLRESTTTTITDPYEIVENQGQTSINNHVIIDNIDELIEQIEPSKSISKLLEQTFSRYQQKYQRNLQHQRTLQLTKSEEQSLTIPPVKLKLHAILRQNSPSPQPSIERPPLKITIRAKLPSNISSEDTIQKEKSPKIKKKKLHRHRHHHPKKKATSNQPETEYAGLTRFEQPLAQLYHQQPPPTPDETHLKDEHHPLSSLLQIESQSTITTTTTTTPTTTRHSGFIIDEQSSPSSIPSIEHRQSSPPLLMNTQNNNDQLKLNYSHLFNFDHNDDHQNNNTFITPPPEIDLNPQQQKANSYENFYRFSASPNKKKHHHDHHHHHHQRKSSATSSASSKSLTNTDYAIDTQALEPVSPTPLTTTRQKHSSSSTTNYDDITPVYFEQQSQKQSKDHHFKKSSSNRSSRPTTTTSSSSSSQIYQQQARSLSNHTYREPPLIPPLPPPFPPPPPIHLDPYAQSYHHFAPRSVPSPPPPPSSFFNFPFAHPFLDSHSTAIPPTHFSHHSYHHPMKYHHHHHHSHSHHPSHAYATHQQQYSYHPHLQRQQQYNNSNYMSSRDHHPFDR